MSKTLKIVLSVAVVIAIGGAYAFPVVPALLGSVVGPDSYFEYVGVNDVRTYSTRRALATATTTPCAIKSPAATSTLVHASLKITTATSTATVWTVAKAASAFATTTSLGSSIALASGAQGTMVASTTFNGLVDDVQIIAPNQYIVWGVQGTAIADATKLNGICQAQFLEI